MATRFTRVTVVGDRRQIDISLPADAPLSEQLPTVLRLLSVPTAAVPTRWRLTAPEFGQLDPLRSLDEVGVLDGTALYLTPAQAVPLGPIVDDVETAIAESVLESAPAWSGAPRRSAIGRLLAVPLLTATGLGLTSPQPLGWMIPAMTALTALICGAVVAERGGWSCALVAVPAGVATSLGVVAAHPGLLTAAATPAAAGRFGRLGLFWPSGWNGSGAVVSAVSTGLAGVLAATAALVLVGIVRRSPGVVAGGAAGAVIVVFSLSCARAGLPTDRTAAVVSAAAVILAGLAGRTGLIGSRLVELLVADERGAPVPRQAVADSVRRGLEVTTGIVWAGVVTGSMACWVLLTRVPEVSVANRWTAPAIGGLVGVVFALRSRMFTRAAQVGPMYLVAVVCAAATALRVGPWLSAGPAVSSLVALLLLMTAVATVLVSGVVSLPEVTGARWENLLGRLETVAILALVPGLVLLFRVIPAVRSWWG